MMVRNGVQAPESKLKLRVTGTDPGFGEIVPANVTPEPRATEARDDVKVMLVDGLLKVVSAVDVAVLVDVRVQSVVVVVVVVSKVAVLVELVAVTYVDVTDVVAVVVDVEELPSTIMLVD